MIGPPNVRCSFQVKTGSRLDLEVEVSIKMATSYTETETNSSMEFSTETSFFPMSVKRNVLNTWVR